MTQFSQLIAAMVAESLELKARFFKENTDRLVETAEVVSRSLEAGRKVLVFGNGGSAADAQHIASEFVGRFIAERGPLPAIALTTDTSLLTAVGNDYGFEQVFARQIEAHGQAGDTAIAISTSGNSPNVLRAAATARRRGLYTIGLTGESGGQLAEEVEVLFRVPSRHTPRIQETHIMIGHFLCELVDRFLYPDAYPKV